MRRDTRANLFFLGVLAVLMGPPIVVTIAKRWHEPARKIEPPPVRNTIAYFDRTPGLASATLPRIVPPRTGDFVAELTRRVAGMQSGLRPVVTDPRFSPIMSEGLNFQLVARGEAGGKYRVALVGWSGRFAPLKAPWKLEAKRDGEIVPADLESFATENMPIELRTELQGYGYILPPDGLIWLIVAADGATPLDSLRIRYDAMGYDVDDRISFPADAAATPASAP